MSPAKLYASIVKVVVLAASLWTAFSFHLAHAAETFTCEKNGTEVPWKSDTEKYVWGQICSAQPAELTQRADKEISGDFIYEIVAREKWSKQIPIEGIAIDGAIIKDLNLENVDINSVLQLKNCEFPGPAQIKFVKAKRLIDLSGSQFADYLNLSSLSTQSSLLLVGVRAKRIYLDEARISENLKLNRAAVGQLRGPRIQIDGSLSIRGGAFDNVNMDEARVAGAVDVTESEDKSPAVFSDQFSLKKSRLGSLSLAKIQSKSLFVNGASIDRNFEITDGKLQQIDASNLTVMGRLQLADVGTDGKAQLPFSLHNANIANIELRGNIQPLNFNLIGLTYKSFSILSENGGSDAPKVDEYINWLKPPPPGEHSPQPYLQLAQWLKTAGYDDKAKKIYIDEREATRSLDAQRSLSELHGWSWWQILTRPWNLTAWRWLGKSSEYWLIGYGYNFAGAWIAVLVLLLIGWGVVRLSPEGRANGFGLTYSFDLLIPLVRLREIHYTTELEPGIRRYFYLHRIVGYVLALFLVAALTGLTKVG